MNVHYLKKSYKISVIIARRMLLMTFFTALEYASFPEGLLKKYFLFATTSYTPFSSYILNHVNDNNTLFCTTF